MEKSLGRKVLTVMSQTFPLKSFELRMSFLVLNMSLNKAAAFISDLSDRGLKIELEKKSFLDYTELLYIPVALGQMFDFLVYRPMWENF